MQVGILGPLEVRDARGVAVKVTGARLQSVLVRLALDAGRPVAAGRLVDAVWGDDPPADEANALQTLVSRLRRAIGDPAVIEQSAAGYRLAVAPSDVDAHRFEQLAADGSRALRDGQAQLAAELLREGLALWRAPALTELAGTAPPALSRLEDLRLSAIVDRLAAATELGESESAARELEVLAAQYPLDERIAVRLISALTQAGRQADALRVYERVRERLADELGVDPSTELQAIHLAVLRGEVEQPVVSRRTNLKAQLTTFVGREEEVARVGKALQENRLVTVVGPGGAGKTRLANEAGARLVTRDGVWLAQLAPVTDSADVAQTVLTALGMREKNLLDRRAVRGSQDAESRLVDVLDDKDAVLVLDNCEHLIDESARLAGHLLEQCPELRVLATSREPLGITGEVVLAVPPLGQPRADAAAATALEYPAVRLFADRAAAARPDFAVDATTVATVIDIVRRLDGLPLAIELAAARLRALPLADIAARLSDRFRLLTGGSRTALPRHQTLRAVVEWSWELLTEPERLLVERLAIFPAGAVAASATAVAADDLVPAEDIEDLLGSLVDKSLLQRVGDGRRLRMLETIREYGIERLAERGELEGLRRAHADYFGRLLQEAEPHLISAGQLPWIALLTAERDNILSALRYRCDAGDADGALQIAVGLGTLAMLLGNHGEVSAWTGDALAVPGGTDTEMRAIARALHAMNVVSSGTDDADLEQNMTRLKEVARDLEAVPPGTHAMFGLMRPAVAFFAGDLEAMRRMLDEALDSDDEWTRASARMLSANFNENEGDVERMRVDVAAALVAFRHLGERWGLANVLRSQAMLHAFDGELDAAEADYAEAYELMAELSSREDEAFLLMRMAEMAVRKGDPQRARELMVRARDRAEETGSAVESVFTLSMLAEIEREAGNAEVARELHAEAARRIEAMPPTHPAQSHGRAIVLVFASRIAEDDGEPVRAMELAREGYLAAIGTKDLPILAAAGVVLVELLAHRGRTAVAAEMLGAAARLRGSDDHTAPDVTRMRELLTASLGEQEYAARYAHGKSLDREAAIRRLDPVEALDG